MTWEEFAQKDSELRHAIQTGVGYEQQIGEDAAWFRNNPQGARIFKHLRTGLNAAMAEQSAMAQLLIKKGIVTQDEYMETSLQALRDEITRYEKFLSANYGSKITLG